MSFLHELLVMRTETVPGVSLLTRQCLVVGCHKMLVRSKFDVRCLVSILHELQKRLEWNPNPATWLSTEFWVMAQLCVSLWFLLSFLPFLQHIPHQALGTCPSQFHISLPKTLPQHLCTPAFMSSHYARPNPLAAGERDRLCKTLFNSLRICYSMFSLFFPISHFFLDPLPLPIQPTSWSFSLLRTTTESH